MTDLFGQTVLITAAAQGIGAASVLAFAKAGARGIATDINDAALAAFDGMDRIVTRRLDVCAPADIAAMAASVGPVDILFNCAGVVQNGTVLEMTETDLDFAFDLNVRAQVRMIQALMPGMIARGGGCIINMSSVAGSPKGVPNRCAYGTTKAAVIGLTKAVAADFVTQGIRCNAICPGTVDSPSLKERLRASGDYETARKAFVARQPIGRVGTPEEIADLAVYLAGATYTTGQTHVIDGGWLN